MTWPFYASIVSVVATWLLLIVGGLVNPMGASMACPDWYFFPTCNGSVLPDMVGGVLYEHGHRLVATMVGICILILTFLCWKSSFVDSITKRLSLLSLLLVVVQGSLGGITVLLNLSAIVSTLHLTCAMIFFCLLIYISFRLSPDFKPTRVFEKSLGPLLVAIILTLSQISLWRHCSSYGCRACLRRRSYRLWAGNLAIVVFWAIAYGTSIFRLCHFLCRTLCFDKIT